MRKLLLAAAIMLALSSPLFAETSCERMEKLRKEWIALEEKTSGGLFFSGPSEVNRLHTLREIMSRAVECRSIRKRKSR